MTLSLDNSLHKRYYGSVPYSMKTKIRQVRGFVVGVLSVGLVAVLCSVSASLHVSAAINQQINFQGKLTNPDGTNVTNGTYSIRFRIYTDPTADAANACSANSCKWEETQASVSVTDGIFQVALGSVNTALASSVDFNVSGLYLGIKVGSDAEMTPRVQFTAAPYAFNSEKLNGISSSGFVQIGQSSAQTDSSTNSGIYINKTSTGNQLQLQASGVDAFVVSNSGNLTFGQNSAKTLSVAQTSTNAAGQALTVAAGQGGAGASANAGGQLNIQGGAGGGTNGVGGNLVLSGGAGAGTGASGSVIVKNPATSTTAFQIQNPSGGNVFTADTTNMSLTSTTLNVGTASSVTGINSINGRIFSDNFETGNVKPWTIGSSVTGSSTVTLTTSTVYNGKYAIAFNASAGAARLDTAIKPGTTYAVRGYVYVSSQGANDLDIFRPLYNGGANANLVVYREQTTGLLKVINVQTGLTYGSTVMSANAWHKVEVIATIGASGSITVYLDGTSVASTGTVNTGSTVADRLAIGDINSRTNTYYMDEISVDAALNGDAGSLSVSDTLHVAGTASFNGRVLMQPSTVSAAAFQVQDTSGASMLAIDTTARSSAGGNLLKIGDSTGTDTATTILQLDGATAAPTTNLAALNGGLFYNSTTNKVNIIENGVVKALCNTTDLGCGAGGGSTLQTAYAASTNPEITLDSTRGALTVRDNATPIGGNLFEIQNNGGSSTYFGVTTTGATVNGTLLSTTSSTTAFQVQNSSNVSLLSVDTTAGDSVNVGTNTDSTNMKIYVGGANQVTVTANTAPTADMVSISNTGQAVTSAGVSGLQIDYVGGAAAVESSAARVDLTPGTTSGGTWNGFRVVANATGAASGVNEYGVNLDGPTSPGAGTEVAVAIDANWDAGLQMGAKTSEPGTVPTDNIFIYARKVAGRSMLRQKGPSGVSFAYQPALFEQAITYQGPNTTTSVTSFGTSWAIDTTLSHPAPSETFGYSSNFATAATANDTAGIAEATQQHYRGSVANGANGFFYVARLGLPDANYGSGATGARIWTGMTSGTAGSMTAGDNPAGDYAGFQYSTNRGDTAWQFISKDNTTQSTPVSTLAVAQNKVYDFYVYVAPQGGTVYWRIDNISDGTTQEGSTTTNLPRTTIAMRAGTSLQTLTTTARNIRVMKHYVESDR